MITEGLLARHYQGSAGGRSPAIIDIAQDHVLAHLHAEGIMDLGIALKGGTALRKLRAGNEGRFSTDLDFASVDETVSELLVDTLDGATVGQFAFAVRDLNPPRRAELIITSPFGTPDIPARLDLNPRKAWLQTETLPVLEFPIHSAYEVTLPRIRTIAVEEAIAEKLARYRRTSLARDLYDLAWLARLPFDEILVRKVTVLKVWTDVTEDGLGESPFEPDEIVFRRTEKDFAREDIGILTKPVNINGWIDTVASRYKFMCELDGFERQVAQCSKTDTWEVRQAIEALGRP